jgi:hypothetical protein
MMENGNYTDYKGFGEQEGIGWEGKPSSHPL